MKQTYGYRPYACLYECLQISVSETILYNFDLQQKQNKHTQQYRWRKNMLAKQSASLLLTFVYLFKWNRQMDRRNGVPLLGMEWNEGMRER